MNLDTASVAELTARLAELDAQRLALKAEGRQVMDALRRRQAEEHAAQHGLTVDAYAAAKAQARADGVPLQAALGRARLQVARAMAAEIRASAKGA